MIKFENIEVVISGNAEELLCELSEIVEALNREVPKELIEIAVKIGLKGSKK